MLEAAAEELVLFTSLQQCQAESVDVCPQAQCACTRQRHLWLYIVHTAVDDRKPRKGQCAPTFGALPPAEMLYSRKSVMQPESMKRAAGGVSTTAAMVADFTEIIFTLSPA